MPKILLLAGCYLLAVFGAVAQSSNNTPVIERSAPFDEPETGASRLLLMKNGNTLLFTFTPKKGINVTVYTPDHKALPMVNSRIGSWKNKKMGSAKLEGFYEMNGEAVVFLQQFIHKQPTLYRLIFDGKSGRLKEERLIADLPRITMGFGYALVFGGVEMPDFTVKKDPLSGYYAVAMLNTRSHETGERIRVIHFSPEHKVISDGFFDTPKGNFKYINLADMHVNGGKSVFLAAFAFNTRASGGRESRFAIGTLAAGDKSFKSVLLNHTADQKMRDVALKFNQEDHHIYMLTTIYSKSAAEEPIMSRSKTDKFSLMMNVINPENLQLKTHYYIQHPMLDKYAQMHLKYKKKYQGVIQDFHLNTDGTIQLLFEEMDIITYTSAMPSGANGSMVSYSTIRQTTRLGEMGITKLSAAGKEINSYAIAKSQEANVVLDILDLNKRGQSNWNFRGKRGGNLSGFYSYDYFNAHQREYTIYNDYAINADSEDENYRSKRKVNYASRTNTICAVYDGKELTKSYLYGAPEGNESRFSQMEMISKAADGASFTTMMIARKGRKKQAYIVWVKL